MAQARTQFENAASTFIHQLGQVDDEVTLLRSTWTGSASVQFGSAMDDWENNFVVVIRELQAVVEAMGGSAAAFTAREGDGAGTAGSWSDFNGGLAGS
jgi:WXG100 family type VII secretion target